MRQRLYIICTLLAVALSSQGQDVVYDRACSTTFLFNWLGAPTPNVEATGYFDLFHVNYVNNFMGRSQSVARSWNAVNVAKDKEYADTIKARLAERATDELWNLADRQVGIVDVAWQVEGTKIMNALSRCENSIGSLSMYGCPSNVKEDYEQRLNCIKEDVSLLQESYQPTIKRKEQYIAVYKSAERLNDELKDVLYYLQCLRTLNGRTARPDRVRFQGICSRCLGKWKDAMGTWYTASSRAQPGGGAGY